MPDAVSATGGPDGTEDVSYGELNGTDERTHQLKEIRVTLQYVFIVLLCCSFVGNLAVVRAVSLDVRRNFGKLSMGLLALGHLCSGIFSITPHLLPFLKGKYGTDDMRWACGMVFHLTSDFKMNFLGYTLGSTLILIVICVERYLIMFRPDVYRVGHRALARRNLQNVLLGIVIVSHAFATLYLLDSPPDEDRVTAPPEDSNLSAWASKQKEGSTLVIDTVSLILWSLVVPIAIVTAFYIRAGAFLRRSPSAVSDSPHEQHTSEESDLSTNTSISGEENSKETNDEDENYFTGTLTRWRSRSFSDIEFILRENLSYTYWNRRTPTPERRRQTLGTLPDDEGMSSRRNSDITALNLFMPHTQWRDSIMRRSTYFSQLPPADELEAVEGEMDKEEILELVEVSLPKGVGDWQERRNTASGPSIMQESLVDRSIGVEKTDMKLLIYLAAIFMMSNLPFFAQQIWGRNFPEESFEGNVVALLSTVHPGIAAFHPIVYVLMYGRLWN